MPEFLTTAFAGAPASPPLDILLRLAAAVVAGFAVAWIYRRTRDRSDVTPTFPITLVLLSILIAMVTQVIGDNVARAFSLVGALSIVRFRTVVRDTQDTAFVIFAVVVGMAVGASDLIVAGIGVGVVGAAAFAMRAAPAATVSVTAPVTLRLRMGVGHDLDAALAGALDAHLTSRRLVSMSTAKQGLSLDVTYEGQLRPGGHEETLVKALNRTEGVQDVDLRRGAPTEE